MVVRGALILTCAGVLLGVVGALALSRFLATLLFEVSTTDPLVFTIAPAVVLVTALFASHLPRDTRLTSIRPSRFGKAEAAGSSVQLNCNHRP